MEAVLKIGGSLTKQPKSLVKLCKELSFLAQAHRIVVLPGGGEFADTVRRLDTKFTLSNVSAHKMAILAMDQFGLLLSDITPDSYVSYEIKEIKKKLETKLPIFLPSKSMFLEDPLENSWDVTSDSISAYFADKLEAKKLILVTDVDGIFTHDPKKGEKNRLIEKTSAKELLDLKDRTSVDKFLPKMILNLNLDCYVMNGKHPERVRHILKNKDTICTHIIK
jgi:aspartokinase-like uncharacterized kinase